MSLHLIFFTIYDAISIEIHIGLTSDSNTIYVVGNNPLALDDLVELWSTPVQYDRVQSHSVQKA